MPNPFPLRYLVIASLLVALPAQQAPAVGSGTTTDLRLTGAYNESTSRDLFRACDGDADDRLDVFEAARALDAIRDAKDSSAFARLDTDRDGFISWPEFDTYLRQSMRREGEFRVHACRPAVLPTPAPQAATPLQQFLQLHDTDQNGGLDQKEIDRMSSLPLLLGGLLKTLDVDHSGRIEEKELAPWFEKLQSPAGAMLLPLLGAPAGATPLPAPWAAADANHNGSIDVDELAKVLRRLDIGLARWAKQLLAALDKDKDGQLGPEELGGPVERTAAAGKSQGPLPTEPPLR